MQAQNSKATTLRQLSHGASSVDMEVHKLDRLIKNLKQQRYRAQRKADAAEQELRSLELQIQRVETHASQTAEELSKRTAELVTLDDRIAEVKTQMQLVDRGRKEHAASLAQAMARFASRHASFVIQAEKGFSLKSHRLALSTTRQDAELQATREVASLAHRTAEQYAQLSDSTDRNLTLNSTKSQNGLTLSSPARRPATASLAARDAHSSPLLASPEIARARALLAALNLGNPSPAAPVSATAPLPAATATVAVAVPVHPLASAHTTRASVSSLRSAPRPSTSMSHTRPAPAVFTAPSTFTPLSSTLPARSPSTTTSAAPRPLSREAAALQQVLVSYRDPADTSGPPPSVFAQPGVAADRDDKKHSKNKRGTLDKARGDKLKTLSNSLSPNMSRRSTLDRSSSGTATPDREGHSSSPGWSPPEPARRSILKAFGGQRGNSASPALTPRFE